MYKIGDVIGHSTMDGISLLEVTDVYKTMSGEICLTTKLLVNDELSKPWSNIVDCIILPQQRYEIRTKEEYFEEMQHEIDKKQNILNELKERYDTK